MITVYNLISLKGTAYRDFLPQKMSTDGIVKLFEALKDYEPTKVLAKNEARRTVSKLQISLMLQILHTSNLIKPVNIYVDIMKKH